MPARRSRPRRSGAVAVLAAVALVLTACSGGDGGDDAPAADGPGASSEAPEIPTLDAAWTSRQPAVGLPPVVGDGIAVLQVGQVLRTIDLRTGDVVSRTEKTPGSSLCSTSTQLDGDLLGVLLDDGPGDCTTVAALDTATGEYLWREQLPRKPDYYQGLQVDVGEGVLVATAFCDEVRRYDLRSGDLLGGPIAPRDRKCANETTTDGHVIAVLSSPETENTPEGIDGFIPAIDEPEAYELYDVRTGRRLWRHPVDGALHADVVSVVSSKPTILTTTEQGHTVQRTWSKQGDPGPPLGLMPDSEDGATVVGQSGGVLVLTYPTDASYGSAAPRLLYGYDVETREELWNLPVETTAASALGVGSVAGVSGEHLLLALADGTGTTVLRYDLRDVSDDTVQTLGTTEGTALGFAGDLLLTSSGSGLAGTAVPEDGLDGTPADLGYMTPGPAWADDDVRPEDAASACQSVSRGALTAAGLDWRGLPTPADCRWHDDYRPEYVRQGLDVSLSVQAPGEDESGEDLTAAEAALASGAALGKKVPELDPEQTVVVDGEPTAAWGGFRVSGGDGFDGYPVQLITVWRNVVITVTANQAVQIDSLMPATAPWAGLQDAVYEATADVITALGGEAELPESGEAGEIDDVTDVCALLRDDATALVPDDDPYRQAPRGGQSACSWVKGSSDLSVLATAVPGALDGTSADDRADEVAEVLPGGNRPTRRIKGVPGATRYSRYGSGDGDYRSVTASTRVGNLVVWLDYTDSDDAPSAEEMDARAAALLAKVVRANT